jgi:hypothetical protein
MAEATRRPSFSLTLRVSSQLENSLSKNDGSPLVAHAREGTPDSTFVYSIKPGGVYVFQTDGSPPNAVSGWAVVTPDTGTSSVAGAGILSFSQGGIRVTEAGAPTATITTRARIYVDQSANHRTGIAIANPNRTASSLTLQAYHTDGTTPAGSSLGPVHLAGDGHTAQFVTELISGLPANFTGVLEISSSTPFVGLTVRSLTNSRGDFLLTTLPMAYADQSAPNPIVFPQIADGDGYQTEFILLTPGAASRTTIDFYDAAGIPLALGR